MGKPVKNKVCPNGCTIDSTDDMVAVDRKHSAFNCRACGERIDRRPPWEARLHIGLDLKRMGIRTMSQYQAWEQELLDRNDAEQQGTTLERLCEDRAETTARADAEIADRVDALEAAYVRERADDSDRRLGAWIAKGVEDGTLAVVPIAGEKDRER